MTVAGIKCTYGGRRWIIINDTSSMGTAYRRTGYTTLVAGLSGADTTLAAAQQGYVTAIEACVTQWKVNSLGFAVGNSSNAATFDKSIRGHGDTTAATKLVSHLRGVGIAGVGWRTNSPTGYEKGGIPIGWIAAAAKVRRVWLFTGIAHSPLNRHSTSPTEEAPEFPNAMAMILPEKWHWLATRAGLISTPYSQIVAQPEMVDDPATSYTMVDPALGHRFTLDAAGNDWHIRMDVAAMPDGHTLTPATMDGPASFWEVMET